MSKNRILVATITGLVVMLGLASVWADGTEMLGIPSIPIASGTGVTAAGVGLAAGPDTISIDVPAGASVEQVLLYWTCFANAGNHDDFVTVNSTPVVGTLIGGPTTFFSSVQGATYRADITGLNQVTEGNSLLTIADLDTCDDSGSKTVNNGAGALVIFDDGVSAPANIEVRDGNDLSLPGSGSPVNETVAQTFVFPASAADRVADIANFFSSVSPNEFRPSAIDVTVNGTTTSFLNVLDSDDGDEWDTEILSVAVPPGATMLTIQAFSEDRNNTGADPASLDWSAAALSLRGEDPPGLDGRFTGGGSNFMLDGVRITKGLQLHCDLRDPNNFQINWPGHSFHTNQLTAALCTEDPAIDQGPPKSAPFDTFIGEGTGVLRVGGARDHDASVQFTLVDAGEPGTNDTAEIIVRDGLGNVVLNLPVDNLKKGNFQAHKD